MSWRAAVLLSGTCAICRPALGENWITVWEGADKCEWSQGTHTVVIHEPGTIKVQAIDTAGGLGHIRSITYDGPPLGGTLDVYVLRDPEESEDPNGARHVGWVNLYGYQMPFGNIAEMRVTECVGYDEDAQTTKAQAITGPFIVLGTVEKPVQIGRLQIAGGMEQGLDVFTLNANLTITGNGPHSGRAKMRFVLHHGGTPRGKFRAEVLARLE